MFVDFLNRAHGASLMSKWMLSNFALREFKSLQMVFGNGIVICVAISHNESCCSPDLS